LLSLVVPVNPARAALEHPDDVEWLVLSPDARTIATATASGDRTIRLWDATTGKLVRTITGHQGGVPVVVFSPDGKQLVSGSIDKTVRVWDVATGKEVRSMPGHEKAIF
jgi:WD40 repeat protein